MLWKPSLPQVLIAIIFSGAFGVLSVLLASYFLLRGELNLEASEEVISYYSQLIAKREISRPNKELSTHNVWENVLTERERRDSRNFYAIAYPNRSLEEPLWSDRSLPKESNLILRLSDSASVITFQSEKDGRREDAVGVLHWWDDATWVLIAQATPRTGAIRREIAFLAGAAIGILLLSTTILTAYFLSQFNRRLRSINAVCEEVETGEIDTRIPSVHVNHELDQISDHINSMLDKISHMMTSLRGATDFTAHQLQNPLVVATMTLQKVHQDMPSEETRRDVELVLGQLENLKVRVDTILRMRRIKIGLSYEPRQTDLGDLFRSMLASDRVLFEPTNLKLITEIEGISCVCDPNLIKESARNLLENALRYAPPHSTIRLSVGARPSGHVGIEVCDEGGGIPEGDLDIAAAGAYAPKTDKHKGHGLGLAFVRVVAEKHGGQLQLSNAEKGLCATIILPRNSNDDDQ